VTHTRLRKFNTRDTYPGSRMDNDLCQVVRAGNIVFLRGQVGQDLDTAEPVGVGDPTAQTEQAMSNVQTLLEEAGSSLDHICKMVVYLTDRAYHAEAYAMVGRRLKGVCPVSTGVIIDGLARPEWVIEIDVTAVIPGDAS